MDDASEILGGVVFLKVVEKIGAPLLMEGWWAGRTRDGKVSIGRTEWGKVRIR